MHLKRLASLILGIWLGGSLAVLWFTETNRFTPERLFRTPSTAAIDLMVKLPQEELRTFLDYQAAEVNRSITRQWEWAQLVLGAIVLILLTLSVSGNRYPAVLSLLMVITVAFLHWFMTPQMEKLGRATDFLPAQQISEQRDRLHSLETGYRTADSIKILLGLVAAGGLIRRRSRSQREIETD